MRVIAGSSRGTRLAAPKGRDVRPTTDRVKESMFAPLQFRLAGAAVLDVFGGTGALGLEAASRGARKVVIVEKARSAQNVIRSNIRACGTPASVELLAMSWQSAFARLRGEQFDFVFVDPPYQSGQYEPVLEALLRDDLLAGGAQVILESDNELHIGAAGYDVVRVKRYGAIYVTTVQSLAGSQQTDRTARQEPQPER